MQQGPGHGYGSRGPSAVRLVWIYPDLLSTYGDRGNLLVLARRPTMEVIANYTAFQQIRALLGRTA